MLIRKMGVIIKYVINDIDGFKMFLFWDRYCLCNKVVNIEFFYIEGIKYKWFVLI